MITKKNLMICDAVLIYWGTADEFWLRTKMRDMIRIRGLRRDKPLAGKRDLRGRAARWTTKPGW